MRHYTTKPRAVETGDDRWSEDSRSLDVIVSDNKPQDTGLLDADGTTIFRVEVRAPIGFMRDEET